MTAEDGIDTTTYALALNRLSVDEVATLRSLALSNAEISPSFESETTSYQTSLDGSVEVTTVLYETTHPDALVTFAVSDSDSVTAGHQVQLSDGTTVVRLTVTTPNGTTLTYTLSLSRLELDESATLRSLALSNAQIAPSFVSETTSYRASVLGSVDVTTVLYETTHPDALVTFAVGDSDPVTDGHQVQISDGTTVIRLTVTTPNGTTLSYTISVIRTNAYFIRAVSSPITEGDQAIFEVSRPSGNVASQTLPVQLTITGDGDMLASSDMSRSAIFDSGSATARLVVETVDDQVWEEHITIRATLTGDSNTSATVRVLDDDLTGATAQVVLGSGGTVSEGAGQIAVTVRVVTSGDEQPHPSLPFSVSTTDGSALAGQDYESVSTTVVINPSDFSRRDIGDGFADMRYVAAKTVNIPIIDDSVFEATEAFGVTVARGAGLHQNVQMAASLALTVTIEDDDEFNLNLASLTLSVGELQPVFGSGIVDYIATLPEGVDAVTVTAIASDPTASISFPPGSASTIHEGSKTVTDVTADGVVMIIRVTGPIEVASKEYSVRIYVSTPERIPPTITIAAVSSSITEGQTASFRVRRSHEDGEALTVSILLSVLGSGDMLADPTLQRTVVFGAEDTLGTLMVATVDDDVWEEHITLRATLQEAEETKAYVISAISPLANVRVLDNDLTGATAKMTAQSRVLENGGHIGVTVRVTTQNDEQPHTSLPVSIISQSGSAIDGIDYEGMSQTIIFQPLDFNRRDVGNGFVDMRYIAERSRVIKIIDDTQVENDETFQVQMSRGPGLNGNVVLQSPSMQTVTIQDDDEYNLNLASLTVSYGGLSPAFSPSNVNYLVTLPVGVNQVQVTGVAQDPNATVTFLTAAASASGVGAASMTVSNVDLSGVSLNARVTAPDRVSHKDYGVGIYATEPVTTPTPTKRKKSTPTPEVIVIPVFTPVPSITSTPEPTPTEIIITEIEATQTVESGRTNPQRTRTAVAATQTVVAAFTPTPTHTHTPTPTATVTPTPTPEWVDDGLFSSEVTQTVVAASHTPTPTMAPDEILVYVQNKITPSPTATLTPTPGTEELYPDGGRILLPFGFPWWLWALLLFIGLFGLLILAKKRRDG